MSGLIRLIYVSELDKARFNSDIIAQILKEARTNNPNVNVTGMLVCNYEFFMQALEGPDKVVKELYDKIARDPRHSNAKVIDVADIDERQFEQWSMGFASPGHEGWPHSDRSWTAFSAQQAMDTLKYAASQKQ